MEFLADIQLNVRDHAKYSDAAQKETDRGMWLGPPPQISISTRSFPPHPPKALDMRLKPTDHAIAIFKAGLNAIPVVGLTIGNSDCRWTVGATAAISGLGLVR